MCALIQFLYSEQAMRNVVLRYCLYCPSPWQCSATHCSCNKETLQEFSMASVWSSTIIFLDCVCVCVCVFQCQPTALLRVSGSMQGQGYHILKHKNEDTKPIWSFQPLNYNKVLCVFFSFSFFLCYLSSLNLYNFIMSCIFSEKADSVILLGFECTTNSQNLIKIHFWENREF